jgi:HSP20 family protein
MALVRWDPFREIERSDPFREIDTLQRQLNRLFDKMLPTDGGERVGLNFIPAAELEETDEALNLRLEIPGIDPKDINVEVTSESVSITGERKLETTTEREGYTRSEFRYGRFQRIIPLPATVKNEQVQAEYKDGILRLRLPKAEPERHKAVKVNIG